ncbi:4-(cytidine 5'-diphospho)-2-C-methyl-D-erythritol kinase, partial [Mesorhizobium sp. M7A.F.Ca.CA.001.10.2.1]
MDTAFGVRTWPAYAKINLALHVTGRRPDGYHLIESLAVFTRFGD